MSLPTNRELREMLEYASPHPWQKEWGFITPSEREPGRLLADLGGAYGDVYPRKEDTDLMLIAPQLAEEVIRLRDEVDRIKAFCLDRCRIAEAAADTATGEAKARAWGKQAAYYRTHMELDKALHGEKQRD